MNMTNTANLVVLPAGKFGTDPFGSQFKAIIGVFNRLGVSPVVANPASDEKGARNSIRDIAEKIPDLVLPIPLRGLSVQAMETAARGRHRPYLIWPTGGGFALPSGSLATGALRESEILLSCFMLHPIVKPERERIKKERLWA
jgi:hypothetical protein